MVYIELNAKFLQFPLPRHGKNSFEISFTRIVIPITTSILSAVTHHTPTKIIKF